jgi:hypothetical protein
LIHNSVSRLRDFVVVKVELFKFGRRRPSHYDNIAATRVSVEIII